MVKLRFKSSQLPIKLPDGWHDVPFVTGLELSTTEADDLEIISKLSGIPKAKLEASTDLETIYYLRQSLLFLQTDPIKKNPEFPAYVEWEGKKVSLPWINYGDVFDLGNCSVIQIEHMQSEIRKINIDDNIQIMQLFPVIAAIYLQPILTGEGYNFDKAKKMVADIEKRLSFKVVINMGSFFLTKLAALSDGLKSSSPNLFSRKRKLRQVFINLAQRLVSMLP